MRGKSSILAKILVATDFIAQNIFSRGWLQEKGVLHYLCIIIRLAAYCMSVLQYSIVGLLEVKN